LLGFYWCASGDVVNGPNIGLVERGKKLGDKFVFPERMPKWLSDADLDVYAGEFEYSGFFGPLSRYRNVDRDWEDLAALRGSAIHVPALFIGGERDGPTVWGAPAIAAFGETLPRLHRSIILEGCGHWTQQERPAEVNEALLDFLRSL
jgi:pimeloyl-ACP methyl ester carboxylesterase